MRKFTNLLFIITFLSFAVASWASLMGQTQSLKGVVASVQKNMLTISNPTSSTSGSNSQLGQVMINTDDQTQFKTIASLDDLKTGDTVNVEYKQESGKRIATTIAKVTPGSEGGQQPTTEEKKL